MLYTIFQYLAGRELFMSDKGESEYIKGRGRRTKRRKRLRFGGALLLIACTVVLVFVKNTDQIGQCDAAVQNILDNNNIFSFDIGV